MPQRLWEPQLRISGLAAVAALLLGMLFAVVVYAGPFAVVGDISTVAGSGFGYAFSGDGGPATSAQLSVPSDVAADSAGNFFIADTGNNRIRKVNATTGVITTVAGTGTAGFSGDGGPATNAQFTDPVRVVVDSAGNLFIADTNNHRIRKVDSTTGDITTVVGTGTYGFSGDGGSATSAQLRNPYGVALDSAGNLFFADSGNVRIRKVDATTGVITTVAGSGTAGFSGDGGSATSAQLSLFFGVAVDSAGNLFIGDTNSHRIRKVDATTGVITTVGGSGTAGFSGDGGPATSAELFWPEDLAVDSAGNLFIADSGNVRIRKVDATTGVIITVAGTGTAGLSGDGGPATSAQLVWPAGLAVDSAGNLFIADSDGHRIRKVEGVAAAPPPPTPTPTPIPGASGLGLGIMAGLMLPTFFWAYRRYRRQRPGTSSG